MNQLKKTVMSTLKVSCIFFLLKVTQCIDGQIPGQDWRLGYNHINRDPWLQANILAKSISSFSDEPQVVKRRLDRFRFFHKGLGKRSLDSLDFASKTKADGEADLKAVDDIRNVLVGLDKFHALRPYVQQYLLARNPNMVLKNTRAFRRLQGLNYLYNKRVPEIFSENLYPLQSGKQKLEASLDHTLDSNEDSLDNSMIDFDDADDDKAENVQIISEVKDNVQNGKLETKSPFDLFFAAPDLHTNLKVHDKHSQMDNDETKSNDGQRDKRWWAANMLSRFRTPKSWSRGVKMAQHVDPALYFIGLGR